MTELKTELAPPGASGENPIPDFEIKGCIGEGAFGQVFLGLSKATGRYRAIKVVRRTHFTSDDPYQTEFSGLKRFEEVSREHEGFVDILHVSRNDQAGYFSYVMELADDMEAARQIDPARYVPRTLAKELERRGRLPAAECVRVALALTAALAELHRRNLVHRDVNPRNIVFVRGAPKLADVGLVTEAHAGPHTLVGTPAYMDPQVQGTPEGDLFSFGKVLYTMATGLPPKQWPEQPQACTDGPDWPVLRELEAIWRRACQPNRAHRYAAATEIHKELLALQAGASVLRLKRFERTLSFLRLYSLPLLLMLGSVGAGLYFRFQEQNQAAELRERKVGSFVANGNHALESGDTLGALSWFAEAWRLDTRTDNDLIHRIRLGSVLQRAPALVQMWFQDRQVKEAFFTGQENQLLLSDAIGHWQVYDLVSGKPLYRPFGMGLPGEEISLSPRTGTAVTTAGTNRFSLWDYQSGAQIREFQRPGKIIKNAVLRPDGRWIASAEASPDGSDDLLLWNCAEQVEPVELGHHPKGTHALKFSPDSRLLLSCGNDTQARVWDLETKQLVCTFTNHQAVVFNGAFSPDSRSVVTASFDRSARIWDARTAKELVRFNHDDAVFGAEFNSKGTLLATAGLDFTARIWDPVTKGALQVLRHNSKVLRTEFSPQNRFFLTSCFDDTVRVWHLPGPPTATPANGVPLLGGLRVIARTNAAWSLNDQSGRLLRSLELGKENAVRFSVGADDRFFAAAWPVDSGGVPELRAQLFDAETAMPFRQSMVLSRVWTNLVISPGGRWLFAFNAEAGTVWDTASGQRVASFTNGCMKAEFSPNGQFLAVARANQVEVFDSERGFARLARCRHPTGSEVNSIRWDPESRRLITACWDTTFTPLWAQVWIARTGEPAGPQLYHRDGVLYATFSHDGGRAITCGEDFTAVIWDPSTGRELVPPLRHGDQVCSAAFSDDDRLVATITIGNVISIWSTDTGEPLSSLALPLAPPTRRHSIRFAANNKAVISREGMERGYFWNLPAYERPLNDLLLTAQLMSGQQTDSTETLMPQSKKALRGLWEHLRARFPEQFSLPSE